MGLEVLNPLYFPENIFIYYLFIYYVVSFIYLFFIEGTLVNNIM